MIAIVIIISNFFTLLTTSFLLEKHAVIKDINLLTFCHLCFRVKNLKMAENCFIAGGAKKLVGLPQELMEKIDMEVNGGNKVKVQRIVKNGQVFYSKEYTRMVKRNGYVVLFACGKVGEIECFVWDRQSGITLAVFREVQPDLQNPFFFSEAGHHILRMRQERYK